MKKNAPIIYPEFEYKLKFDGCSKGNPGLGGAGAVIYYKGNEIWSSDFFVGKNVTNNYAEYSGLIFGLIQAKDLWISQILVEGDSLLVINQMKGLYKCKSENLQELHNKAKELLDEFKIIEFRHIYRSENERADELSNIAINKFLHSY